MRAWETAQDGGLVEAPRIPRQETWPTFVAVTAVLLIAGFGDGIGFALATLTGQRSPWIFLLPILVVPLGVYLVARGPGALSRTDKLLVGAFGAFSVLVLLVESRLVVDFYLAGLLQLLVFVLVAVLVSGVFASAPPWLDTAFRRSLPIVHYFLSSYVVLSYISWHFLRWDPSIRAVLTTTSAQIVDYYGFRPSGFSEEPQWAAIALAASYSGVHYLMPKQRLNAFIALLVAAEALQSGTGYVFVAVVVALYAFQHVHAIRGRGLAVIVIGVLLAIVVGLAILGGGRPLLGRARDEMLVAAAFLQSAAGQLVIATVVLLHEVRKLRAGRRRGVEVLLTGILLAVGVVVATIAGIQPAPAAAQSSPGVAQPPLGRATNVVTGQDPSTAMRLTSADVAWHVIERSFPLGVGYGNFRKYAVYPSEFAASGKLDELGNYKSDISVLNYLAELGVLGAILVICLVGLLIRTRHALIIAFAGLIAGLSGTLLLPPVLAIAAVVGLLVRDKREQPTTAQRVPIP